MWFSSWLRNRTVSATRRPANRFRPQLEVLEDRCVPATFLVTTVTDVLDPGDGVLSLREAIIAANATPNKADTIVLPAGTYTLTRAGAGENGSLTGDLDINGPLTINGAGAGSTVIDGGGMDRVFDVPSPFSTVNLSGMTLQGGYAGFGYPGPHGGGIYNVGTLTVTNCVLSGNSADNTGHGGGIYNRGTLTVNNSLFSGNSAGAGGGISNFGGTLTVSNSTLSGNTATYSGGAISNSGTATVTSSTLSGNTALNFGGGGILNSGKLTVSFSTLSNSTAPRGGGIYISSGTVMVRDSTLSGNSATDFGGGIFNGANGKLTVRGSNVLNNFAPVGAGADLYNLGSVSLFGSTIGDIDP